MNYSPDDKRYNSIDYVRCGKKTGLLLPKISLGLWHNFGSKDVFDNARMIVQRAFDLGITYFDLANNYGPVPGSAEENFGSILKKDLLPYRDELLISSKAGFYMSPGPYGEFGSRKHILSSLNQSLQRTGLEYFDIFYSHRPDPNTPMEETMQALDYSVRSGKALYAGISNYSLPEAKKAIRILDELGTPCIVHQPQYNILQRNNQSLIDGLHELGLGCTAFSPLAQGLLTNKYLAGVPEKSRVDNGSQFLNKETVHSHINKVKELNVLAEEWGIPLAQMAVNWLLSQPQISSVIIGASKPQQIDDAITAARLQALTKHQLEKIEVLMEGYVGP